MNNMRGRGGSALRKRPSVFVFVAECVFVSGREGGRTAEREGGWGWMGNGGFPHGKKQTGCHMPALI